MVRPSHRQCTSARSRQPTVAGGFYPTGQSVDSAATTAAIYYTLDGSIPTNGRHALHRCADCGGRIRCKFWKERYGVTNPSAPSPPKLYFIDENFFLPPCPSFPSRSTTTIF
ncbi:MAG: chitobiase/beta-hexosaminidase C-terminal domain-containing protein [Chloroflexi bacterium]|nr:chitobiase/beta-hexosaminidase C-terminal domain-containing protein [Chloroflexota bacterium]